MKVYELIQKLLEVPAGSNVYIKISNSIYNCDLCDEVLVDLFFKGSDGYVFITTKD